MSDHGIHTASGARLQHDGGRLVIFKLPVLFHTYGVRKPSSLLVVSLSRGTRVTFAQTQVHSSFMTRSRPNTAKHTCVPQLQFDYGYMGDGGPLQIACFIVGTNTSSGAIHATMVPDALGGCRNSQMGA